MSVIVGKRRSFESSHYLGWNSSKRQCMEVDNACASELSPAPSLGKRRQRSEDCTGSQSFRAKRQHQGKMPTMVPASVPVHVGSKRSRSGTPVHEPCLVPLPAVPAAPVPEAPPVIMPEVEGVVSIPQNVVLGIWNHRNALIEHVQRLEAVIAELRHYIQYSNVGGPHTSMSLCCGAEGMVS